MYRETKKQDNDRQDQLKSFGKVEVWNRSSLSPVFFIYTDVED